MFIISERVARQVVTIADAFAAVEECYLALHKGQASLFPVAMGHGVEHGTRFSVKSGLDIGQHAPGLKIGTYWPRNRGRGLPNHGSTTLLLDDETGFPKALVAATYLNGLRTAAADAVAVKHLARPDAARLGIIGGGNQAFCDLQAIAATRQLASVRVWSRSASSADNLATRARAIGLAACVSELEALVKQSDIIVTATASREALYPADWVAPGTHVSAMGADGPGKQELDPQLLARARLFADVVDQAISIGEFKTAHSAGLIDIAAITPIGAVIANDAGGRGGDNDITVFDSSGVAMQDLAIALVALRRAREADLAQVVEFF